MRRLVVMVAALACGAAAGCGGDDAGPEDQVRDAVREYLTAVAAADEQRACATLTPEGQREVVDVVTSAFPDAGDMGCDEAMRELSADIAPADREPIEEPAVGDVTIDGDRASAEVERLAERIPLRRVDGEWRLARGVFAVEG